MLSEQLQITSLLFFFFIVLVSCLWKKMDKAKKLRAKKMKKKEGKGDGVSKDASAVK